MIPARVHRTARRAPVRPLLTLLLGEDPDILCSPLTPTPQETLTPNPCPCALGEGRFCDTAAMNMSRLRHRDNVPAARDLRVRQTSAEGILWEALRNRRLDGLKFRRQHPVGPFVLDFCCPERRLAIELDGAVHAAQLENDAEREAILATAGYRIVRFPNDAVQNDLSAVLAAIRATAAREPRRSASPLPRTGAW
jgi:very-short-patch-repair endonuclease